VLANKSALSAAQGAALLAGSEYKIARHLRVDEAGGLRTAQESLFLFDACEGAAVNTNTWIQTVTTMTIAQAAATGIQFNAGSSVAATVGAMHTSHRRIPKVIGSPLLARFRVRATAHFANNLHELGFGSPATATTASIGDGVVWRKDGSGQWLPVISINGAEILGTPISNATLTAAIPATDYFVLTVEVKHSAARFCIYTQSGTLVTSQDIDLTQGASLSGFAVTHLQLLARTYNSGTVATAVQLFMDECSVFALDGMAQRPWPHVLSGMGFNASQSPTAFTQNQNYTNNTAPTTRTPSNTAAGEATLGGHISWSNGANSFPASDTTDLILFGWQNPSPYTFYFTGLNLSTINLGAANGAAIYALEYALAFNASAVSLATAAPYAPRFMPVGVQTLANAAAIGASFDKDTVFRPNTPIAVMPGRFLHLVARVVGGSLATASQVIRTVAAVDGYFE
jgi:hypothetical protein